MTPASTSAPEAADAAGTPTPQAPAAAETVAPDPVAPEGAPTGTAETTTTADAPAPAAASEPAAEAPASEAAASADSVAVEATPVADATPSTEAAAPSDEQRIGEAPASEAAAASPNAEAPAAPGEPASTPDQPAGEPVPSGEQASGEQAPAAEGDGEGAPKKRRRSRGRRQGRGGQRGGRRRFQWDEVFLRQRLEILRAMEPDRSAIEWAVTAAGRFDVADILAGEGSSGREFGRRAYGATPETDDQAAWIILSAVRARDIVPVARLAVSTTEDQREQVKAAIELVGIARVNPALQGDRPPQQVFAERARRVDVASEGGEEQKAAWALLSLARPQDVKFHAAPRRPRPGGPGGPGGRPGGPGGGRFGDDDRRGRRREPALPGGKFSVGESGIGGELGAKLRAALEAAENGEVADTRDQD